MHKTIKLASNEQLGYFLRITKKVREREKKGKRKREREREREKSESIFNIFFPLFSMRKRFVVRSVSQFWRLATTESSSRRPHSRQSVMSIGV